MAVIVEPQAGAAPSSDGPADVFVAFGITRDLAKVMAFRSLYRLGVASAGGGPISAPGGPKAADHQLAGTGRWHEPWVGS